MLIQSKSFLTLNKIFKNCQKVFTQKCRPKSLNNLNYTQKWVLESLVSWRNATHHLWGLFGRDAAGEFDQNHSTRC